MVIEEVRERAQDFTLPYYYDYTTIAYRKPEVTSKMYIYLKPFRLNVSKNKCNLIKVFMLFVPLFPI